MMSTDSRTDDVNGMMLFLLGAASGAVLASLFAPASGRQTRAYLVNGARQARDQAAATTAKARELTGQGRDVAVQAIDDVRSKIDNTLAFGRETIEQGKATVSRAIEEGRDVYQRVRSQELPPARQA
jgi:gas vesicle protein